MRRASRFFLFLLFCCGVLAWPLRPDVRLLDETRRVADASAAELARLDLEADVGNVPVNPAFLSREHAASARLASARSQLAGDRAARVAAIQAHADRLARRERSLLMRTCGPDGARPGWAEFKKRREQAERWLAWAKSE